MARFTGRNLGLIDRLFQLPAGSSSAPIDYGVESPIQPVHDVGRLAEIAAGYGVLSAPGWWWFNHQQAHVGADTVASSINPRTVIASAAAQFSIPPNPTDIDVWLYDQYIHAAVATLAGCRCGILYPTGLPGATGQPYRMTFQSTAAIPVPVGSSADSVDAAIPIQLGNQYRPLQIPIGATLEAQSTSTGATTVSVFSYCWVGPKGARPPGLA